MSKPVLWIVIPCYNEEHIREGFNHLRDGKEYDRLYEAWLQLQLDP